MIAEKIDTAIAELGALGHQVSPEVWEKLRCIMLHLQGTKEIAGGLEVAALALPMLIADQEKQLAAGRLAPVQ